MCGGREGISVPLNFRPRLNQRLFVTLFNSSRSVLASDVGSTSFLFFLCNCICFHKSSYQGRPEDSPTCRTACLCDSLRLHSNCNTAASTFNIAKIENSSYFLMNSLLFISAEMLSSSVCTHRSGVSWKSSFFLLCSHPKFGLDPNGSSFITSEVCTIFFSSISITNIIVLPLSSHT